MAIKTTTMATLIATFMSTTAVQAENPETSKEPTMAELLAEIREAREKIDDLADKIGAFTNELNKFANKSCHEAIIIEGTLETLRYLDKPNTSASIHKCQPSEYTAEPN